jgi:hypothetical protein
VVGIDAADLAKIMLRGFAMKLIGGELVSAAGYFQIGQMGKDNHHPAHAAQGAIAANSIGQAGLEAQGKLHCAAMASSGMGAGMGFFFGHGFPLGLWAALYWIHYPISTHGF